MMWNRRQI